MDKLNTIAIFISAAQYRSFSEAARRLGMSPSAVSKAVQRLEERLGTRLLNRTTRSISLTEDGAVFYESCRQILSDLEDAELALSHTHAIPSGTLRLSLTLALGQLHIVPVLPKLLARYPQLQLDVSLSDRFVDLIEDGIDAVVRVGISPDSRLIMHRLATARFVVCASLSYFAHYGIPETLEDLMHHNCINFVVPETGRNYEWLFHKDEQEVRLAVEGNLRLDSGEALVNAAINGAGVIQVLNYIVRPAIARGLLKPVLEDYVTSGLPIAVIYPQKRHLSAKVRAFVDFMIELMAQLKQEGIVD